MNAWVLVSIAAAPLVLGLIYSAIEGCVKSRRRKRWRELARRLNSPYFRNIYDRYYRAGRFQ
jgi:hypothetical protein